MSFNSFCEVYLIRHGQTQWNVEGRLQGHTDTLLTKEGENQALFLREKFQKIRFAAVFSSDLSRACKTAAILLGHQNIAIVNTPALRERSLGFWEGRLTSDLEFWFKEQNISTDNFSKEEYLFYKWQNDIESYFEVYARLNDFIKLQAMSHLGSSILLSTHGGVLRALLYQLNFHPKFRWQVTNCAWIKLRMNSEGELMIIEYEGAQLYCMESQFKELCFF